MPTRASRALRWSIAAVAAALMATGAGLAPASAAPPQAGDTYRAVGSLQVARSGFAIAADPATGLVYVAGGVGRDGEPLDSVEVFDPATAGWTLLEKPMPVARTGAVGVVHDGALWVIGGSETTSAEDVYRLDLTSGEWSDGPLFPAPFSGAAAAASTSGIIVSGGEIPDGAGGSDPNLTSYLLTATSVTELEGADLAFPSVHGAGLGRLGELVVAGGTSSGGFPVADIQTVYPFSQVAGGSDPAGSLLIPRSRMGAAAVGATLVLFGGLSGSVPTASAEQGDPYDGFAPISPLPVAASGLGAALLPGGDVLVTGGTTDSEVLDTTYVYRPTYGSTQQVLASVVEPPGELSIAVSQGTVDLGATLAGERSAEVPVGVITYRNTLGEGTPWSASVAASNLGNGIAEIPYSALRFGVGSVLDPDDGAVTPGVGGDFGGTGTMSDPLTLVTGSGSARGDVAHDGSTLQLTPPPGTSAGGFSGTLQYTIVG